MLRSVNDNNKQARERKSSLALLRKRVREMLTLIIIYASFALALYVNHKYTQYVETREQRRLEALERELEEQHFEAIMKLMFD